MHVQGTNQSVRIRIEPDAGIFAHSLSAGLQAHHSEDNSARSIRLGLPNWKARRLGGQW